MNRPYEPMPPDSDDEVKRLWRAQSVPTSEFSIEELQRTAKRFRRQIVRRNARELVACAVVVLVFSFYLLHVPFPITRIGSALTIVGTLVLAWQLRSRASAGPDPVDLGERSWIDYHRAQLIRQRDALNSVAVWYLGPLVPGYTVFLWGATTELGPQSLGRSVVMILLAIAIGGLVIALNRHAARKLQQSIDRLEQETR